MSKELIVVPYEWYKNAELLRINNESVLNMRLSAREMQDSPRDRLRQSAPAAINTHFYQPSGEQFDGRSIAGMQESYRTSDKIPIGEGMSQLPGGSVSLFDSKYLTPVATSNKSVQSPYKPSTPMQMLKTYGGLTPLMGSGYQTPVHKSPIDHFTPTQIYASTPVLKQSPENRTPVIPPGAMYDQRWLLFLQLALTENNKILHPVTGVATKFKVDLEKIRDFIYNSSTRVRKPGSADIIAQWYSRLDFSSTEDQIRLNPAFERMIQLFASSPPRTRNYTKQNLTAQGKDKKGQVVTGEVNGVGTPVEKGAWTSLMM